MTAQSLSEVELPRVSGRHRDKALAAARKIRAVELKAQGMTYQQIADAMGYASRASVHAIVQGAVRAQEVQGVADYRTVEIARLDALQAALWGTAMTGNATAALAIIRISDARCRLMGLYAERRRKDPRAAWDNCAGPATVVVRADDCRHLGCDRHGSFASPGERPMTASLS